MTFAEKIEQVRKEDPDFAKSVKRIRAASWVFGIAVVVALIFGIWAVVVNGQQETRFTKIERKSACEEHPHSFDCQHTKQEASRAASVYTNCISIRAVGYPCPAPGSGITIKPSEKGVMPSTPPPGHSQPGPPSSGPPDTSEPSSPAPETSAPTSPEEPAHPIHSTLEEVGETVHGIVCSVNAIGVRICP